MWFWIVGGVAAAAGAYLFGKTQGANETIRAIDKQRNDPLIPKLDPKKEYEKTLSLDVMISALRSPDPDARDAAMAIQVGMLKNLGWTDKEIGELKLEALSKYKNPNY